MTGDIINYLEKNNYLVNVEGPDGGPRKAILIADSKAADPNTSQPVNIVENSAPSVEHFMYEELNDANIVSVSADRKQITFEPGHGFLNPVFPDIDYFNIHYVDPDDSSFVGTRFAQVAVISVSGDVVDITPPLGFVPELLKIERQKRVNINMAVLGTRLAPLTFKSFPPNGQIHDLRRFIGSMILSTAGDDGLFGNIARLTNGEYFGFENPVFKEYNLFIFDNSDFRASGYDVEFVPRSGGGGTHGMSFRKTLAGLEKSGVVLTLDGGTSDELVKITQDDLTGLVRYVIKVMGNIKS